MSDSKLEVTGRSRLPDFVAPIARSILAKLAIRGSNVSYGRGFRVGRRVVISAPHSLEFGNWVSVGPNSIIQVNGSIGDFCLIGMHVQLVGRDDHAVREVGVPISLATWAGDRDATPRDALTIGRDVWIGGGSIVLSGLTIGEGSVVAAGSVVTRDVPPFSIIGGNPARVIGDRFTNAEREDHMSMLDKLSARPF